MPVWGTGPRRLDGGINNPINATPTYGQPSEIPGLALWFDAADTSTIRTNISSLNQWWSKTSISTVMSNAFGLPGPTWVSTTQNRLPVVRFRADNSTFMSSFRTDYPSSNFVTSNETTMFLAYNPTNFGAPFGVVDTASRGGGGTRLHPQSGGSWFFGNLNTVPNNARIDYSYPVNTGFKVETYLGRESTLAFRNNGSLFAASTMLTGLSFPNQNNVVIMGGLGHNARLFSQDIGEAILYNRGLSDAEILNVEAYLAAKWNVRTTMPFNHPARVVGPPILGYRLLSYPTLAASNAALWFDTMDTASMRGLTTQRFPPNNLDFCDFIVDKASGCNSFTTRWPVYDLFAWNYKPTLKYIANNPVNARLPGVPSPFRGSSLSMFLAVNATGTPFGSNIITIGEDQGNPGSRGLSIYFNTSTIGVQRGGNLISSFYQTGSNILVSAFVNGTTSTIGGLPPSTTSLFFNGSLVATTPTPSTLSSFNLVNYCMGGNNNFQNFQGNISEWNVFYRMLGTSERNAMHAQMLPKWSLPSNIPIAPLNDNPVTNGLFGWYDAYDETTILRNSSNNVSMWLDKSGQNNHMSTNLLTFGSNTRSNIYYSSISISTNQFPSLFFPSTFAFMQTSTLITNETFSTFTMIAVKRGTKVPNGPQPRTVSMFSTLNALENGSAFIGADTDSMYNIGNQNPQFVSNFSTFHINTLVGNVGRNMIEGISSASAVTYFNGRSSNVTGGYTYRGDIVPTYVRLMNAAFNDTANGDTRTDAGFLAEVLLYNRILNSNEFFNVHTYLLNKWNISTLVSNVPVTSGLNLWLDCYDSATMTFSTNTTQVIQWRDKSISSLHFSNALTSASVRPPLYTTNPVNSLPGLLFSNSAPISIATGIYNCNFNYPVTREATIFTVAQWNSGNASFYSPVFCMLSNNEFVNNTANSFTVVGPVNGLNVNLYRSSPGGFLSNIGNTLDRPTLVTGVFNSTFTTIPDIPQNNIAVGRNGVIGSRNISSFISTLGNGLAISTTNFNVNQAVLGLRAPAGGDATWFHAGYIHEIILYNRALSFSERQQVESYLMAKWNI
jgi:hypothetical protein